MLQRLRNYRAAAAAELISRGIEPSTLSTSTLWWKGIQRLSQEPSSWSITEIITPTDKLEFRNLHVAHLKPKKASHKYLPS